MYHITSHVLVASALDINQQVLSNDFLYEVAG